MRDLAVIADGRHAERVRRADELQLMWAAEDAAAAALAPEVDRERVPA